MARRQTEGPPSPRTAARYVNVRGPGERPAPRRLGGRAYAPDRPALPARVSSERLPARGRVTGFKAPHDASSLAVNRRDWVQRRREPSLMAVRIAIPGYLPGRPPRGKDERTPLSTRDATPRGATGRPPQGPLGARSPRDARCRDRCGRRADPTRDRSRLPQREADGRAFVPPAVSVAVTVRDIVPADAAGPSGLIVAFQRGGRDLRHRHRPGGEAGLADGDDRRASTAPSALTAVTMKAEPRVGVAVDDVSRNASAITAAEPADDWVPFAARTTNR